MATISVTRRRASTDQPRTNATAKAETLTVDYYLDGDTMIIACATIPGRLYIVTSGDCTCPAGVQELPCKHAEFRLNVLYPRPTAQQTNAHYTVILDLDDELF
jgi:hypothetical protein